MYHTIITKFIFMIYLTVSCISYIFKSRYKNIVTNTHKRSFSRTFNSISNNFILHQSGDNISSGKLVADVIVIGGM